MLQDLYDIFCEVNGIYLDLCSRGDIPKAELDMYQQMTSTAHKAFQKALLEASNAERTAFEQKCAEERAAFNGGAR